jgi:hypothetical protein
MASSSSFLDGDNVIRTIYLQYEVEDLNTLINYHGNIEIGSIKAAVSASDTSLETTIQSWIGTGVLHPECSQQYIQYWSIPHNQFIADMNFNTDVTYTDIADNLKIPRYILSSGKCVIGNRKIKIIRRPQHSTKIG